MTKARRQFILIAFIAAFLAIAPILLLRAAGYRYNWSKQALEKTGLLRVETEPDGATVLLDGKTQARQTPMVVDRLLPDDYRLQLEKTGYLSWEKELEVRSGKTTFATDVILLKDVLPKLVLPGRIATSAVNERGEIAALVAGDSWTELVLLRSDKPEIFGRFPKNGAKDAALTWSPAGDMIMLTARNAAGKEFVSLLPTDGVPSAAAPEAQVMPGLRRARWSSDGQSVLVADPSGFYRMAVAPQEKKSALEPIAFIKDAFDATMRGSNGYLLRTDGRTSTVLRYARFDGGAGLPLAVGLPGGYKEFIEAGGPYLVIRNPESGQAMALDPFSGQMIATFKAAGASWFGPEKNGRMLIRDAFEISVWDPANDSKTVITRLGTPIGEARWIGEAHYVAYATPTSVSAIEVDDRGSRNVYDLARFSEVSGFWTDEPNAKIRFAGAIGNQVGIFEREW